MQRDDLAVSSRHIADVDVSRMTPAQVSAEIDRLKARQKEVEEALRQQQNLDEDRLMATELRQQVERLEEMAVACGVNVRSRKK